MLYKNISMWAVCVFVNIGLCFWAGRVLWIENYGHTGVNPKTHSFVFASILVGVLFVRYLFASKSYNMSSLMSAIACLFGFALTTIYVKYNIVLEYGAWLHSGMPVPPSWASDFVMTYLFVYAFVLLLALLLLKLRRMDSAHRNNVF